MVNIALDAMGGDHAPVETVQGAVLAVKQWPITITLVGQEAAINAELAKCSDYPNSQIKIVDAPEIVEMSESPAQSFRKKKSSSIRVGIELLKSGDVSGFVSAGNTGAVMTTSTLVLGRAKNVERPCLAVELPSTKGYFLLLDVGSNVDSKSSHLTQFAVMGHYFSKLILGVDDPKIGLLNIGEEPDKGDMMSQETFKSLQEKPVNFIGNVEGKDILFGAADVVVCDGFVGNNLLKFGEGVTSLFMDFFKREAKVSVLSMLGFLFLKPALRRFKEKYDYEEHGGAPLLGVNGVSVIAHGKSSRFAVKNAIRIAHKAIEQSMVDKIERALSQ